METIIITPDQIEAVIQGFKGRVFSIEFIKKDGTRRKMTCRRGVRKGVTGKGLRYDPRKRELLTVYEFGPKDEGEGRWRMIPTNTRVQVIRHAGMTIKVAPGEGGIVQEESNG